MHLLINIQNQHDPTKTEFLSFEFGVLPLEKYNMSTDGP